MKQNKFLRIGYVKLHFSLKVDCNLLLLRDKNPENLEQSFAVIKCHPNF